MAATAALQSFVLMTDLRNVAVASPLPIFPHPAPLGPYRSWACFPLHRAPTGLGPPSQLNHPLHTYLWKISVAPTSWWGKRASHSIPQCPLVPEGATIFWAAARELWLHPNGRHFQHAAICPRYKIFCYVQHCGKLVATLKQQPFLGHSRVAQRWSSLLCFPNPHSAAESSVRKTQQTVSSLGRMAVPLK